MHLTKRMLWISLALLCLVFWGGLYHVYYYIMKKIIMSNCQYMRLALNSLLVGDVMIKPIDYRVFSLDWNGDISLFIHVDSSDIQTISELAKHKKSILFKETTFITHRNAVSFFSFISSRHVKFIDQSISAEEIKSKIHNGHNLKPHGGYYETLTTSEMVIFKKLLAGMRLTSIAISNKKSIKTISSQKISALQKLNLANSAHSMVQFAKYLNGVG